MYQVLALKWRPKKFAELIGQEHVVRALVNAINQNRLHHAYLFTGTRGVGKTTIARIIAKCLNCETGITATPCCNCDACLEIDAGRFFDLIEVDAASRTRVEDTRDLLENVQYLPTSGRYKIYLIDEVHMLSGHSFNALLKTLEEPPAHVKFLLATTDPQKLPITVLSRCLQFNLKQLPITQIQQHLSSILRQENLKYDNQALLKLATAAQGSVRDALSLLDQAIAYTNGDIQFKDVCTMLGTIEATHIIRILDALAAKNANSIMQIVAELAELATDFTCALDELLNLLHQLALLQMIPALDHTITGSWNHVEKLQELAQTFNPEDIQLYYQIAIIGKRDLPLAPTPRNSFEMTLLRMLAFQPITPKQINLPQTVQITKESKTFSKTQIIPNSPKQADPGSQPSLATSTLATSIATTNSQSSNDMPPGNNTGNFGFDILTKLKVSGPTLALLKHCSIATIKDSYVALLLDPSQAPLLNKKQEERLSAAFSDYFQKPMTVTISLGDHNITTLTSIENATNLNKKIASRNAIEQDKNIQVLIQKFNASIVPESPDTFE